MIYTELIDLNILPKRSITLTEVENREVDLFKYSL